MSTHTQTHEHHQRTNSRPSRVLEHWKIPFRYECIQLNCTQHTAFHHSECSLLCCRANKISIHELCTLTSECTLVSAVCLFASVCIMTQVMYCRWPQFIHWAYYWANKFYILCLSEQQHEVCSFRTWHIHWMCALCMLIGCALFFLFFSLPLSWCLSHR